MLLKNIVKICFAGALLTIPFLGCKKFVEVPPPKTQVVNSEVFKDSQAATSAVLGIYINMLSDFDFENSGVTAFSGLSADELEDFNQITENLQFQNNALLPSNGTIANMWGSAYKTMLLINTCIEGLKASSSLTPAVKNQLLGECEFDRAFINFYLVNLWGNVPLVISSDWRQNQTIGQSSPATLNSAIIADLKSAQTLLTESYPTDGHVRPNKWAATALLARVYLYNNDYANAEIQADAVIKSGIYTPLPNPNDAFLASSQEAIWQLMPSQNIVLTTQEAVVFLGYTGNPPNFTIKNSLFNSFEAGDARKTDWITSLSYNNQFYNVPFKYKDIGTYGSTTPSEYYIMLRCAEQFLIRAEARAQLNKTADALVDLNMIRNRAQLPNLQVTDKATLLMAIANENRHEFFTEWGHRWLDLKRTNQAAPVLSLEKKGWKSTDVLYPIPQTDINTDRQLKQNPGY
ncbi:RagB/SusD family nutrient uptake outer membrane protein [Mucilaginibacter pocheonensis]|uniref:RagB/SusD domain-containing protein n=1 Tax=Mucilaginibacter pocheonensis TaxID=398050 RepID=A0ABU1TFZ5_9SPHI|nr:RagB/SusD family nutrient uptake outer membrane protein [Mucilaginibacter pocheonensis]MDR6943755.1 hypothetical protein [Mucilaginibacter pocheonensis]